MTDEIDNVTVCAWRPAALSSARVAEMSRDLRMVLTKVACSPRTRVVVSLNEKMSTKARVWA